MKAFNPAAAIVCEVVAFGFIANSSWFKNRSPIWSSICTVIGSLYFAFTAIAAGLACAIQCPERELVGLVEKLCIQEVVCIIIAILTYVFSEHHPDKYIALAFMFIAYHMHFAAHSYGVHEDFGIAQGFMTVSIAAALHLAENLPMKFVVIVVGSSLIAIYNLFLNKEVLRVREKCASDIKARYEPVLLIKDASFLDLNARYEAKLLEKDTAFKDLKADNEAALLEKDTSFSDLKAEYEAALARFRADLAEKDGIISELRRRPAPGPSGGTGLRARFTSGSQNEDLGYTLDTEVKEKKSL